MNLSKWSNERTYLKNGGISSTYGNGLVEKTLVCPLNGKIPVVHLSSGIEMSKLLL